MNLPMIKKKLIGLTMAIAVSVTLIGCGNTQITNPIESDQANIDSNSSSDVTTSVDDRFDPSKYSIYEYESGSDHAFKGLYTGIEVTGIEEFDKIESDSYVDLPSEGNVFVVFYIDLVNYLDNPYYFAPEHCEFVVDGQDVHNTILVNDPKKDSKTIFGNVVEGATGYYYDRRGFLVIEAPKEWQNIKFTYTGWAYDEFANAVIINHFTRSDLEKSE